MSTTTMEDTLEGEPTIDLPSGDALLLAMFGLRGNAPPFAMDYLPLRDRMQLLLVSRSVRSHLREVEYYRCKDGRLYKIPFPGFPGLLDKNDEGLFPHQLASLQAMHRAENHSHEFGALRGGILGDAPGLGKTITMLALITSTAGKRPRAPPDFWSPQQMQEGWQAFTQNPYCEREITKAIGPFRSLAIYSQLEKQVRPPFPLQRFPTIDAFEHYIRTTARHHGADDMDIDQFRQNLLTIKAGLHKSNRKLLMSDAGKRQAWERSLVPSCATLLIVPDALLEHWFQQIHLHVNRELFTEWAQGRGVVYLDGVGDIADARMPLGETLSNNKQSLLQPWNLAKYLIVVTTFSRCEQEYFKEVELGNLGGGGLALQNSKKRSHTTKGTQLARSRLGRSDEEVVNGNKKFHSSLLNMRWLRVVVDEGHELGTHEGGNGLTRFIHQLAAERRWVLSGTPTTGDEDAADFSAKALDQMQRLLQFLRHPVYGSSVPSAAQAPLTQRVNGVSNRNPTGEQKQKAKLAWVAKVKEPFLQKNEEGRAELLRVLRSVAVLHRKEDIHLPKPIFRNSEVDVPIPDNIQKTIQDSPENAEELLGQYLKTDAFQELVDRAQGGYILAAIEKAKADLQERGGPFEPLDQATMRMWKPEDIHDLAKDRRPIKAVVYSTNSNNLKDVTEYLLSKLSFENVAEAYDDPNFDCGAELSRFRNNLKEVRSCPVCGHHNDFEGTAKEKRNPPMCKNFLLEVVKRNDVNVRFLVEAERITQAVPVIQGGNVPFARLGGLHYSQYSLNRKAWRVGDVLEVNIRDPHPVLKKRESDEQWQDWGVEKCKALAERDNYFGTDWFLGPLPDGNGLETMEVVLQKWQHCGKFHNHSGWYEGPRLVDTPLQLIRENTFILSLDAGLATGLDLSFVTHIFLLEPVEDAALLEQITSRAHRLGATGPVIVDTVNPYYNLQPATEAAVKESKNLKQRSKKNAKKGASHKSSLTSQDKSALTKAVCQFCYRAFDSMNDAVAHENSNCARNPETADVINQWHISSAYREIRPPPPFAFAQQRGQESGE